MKRLIAVVVAVALPVMAHGSTLNLGAIKSGTYEGTFSSPVAAYNGQKAVAVVTNKGNEIELNVSSAPGSTDSWKETWTLSCNTLNQKELDPTTGAVAKTYTATSAEPCNGTYNINVKDKAKNECDAGTDCRYYWTVSATNNGFVYSGFGVGKEKIADATAKAEPRFNVPFKFSNPIATSK